MSAILAIETDDGAELSRCTLDQFVADNEMVDEPGHRSLPDLNIGESITFGGGAGPLLVVRRIA